MGQAAREMIQKYRNTLDSPTKAKYATSTKFDNVAWNGVTVFEFDRILYAVGANKEPLARLFFCKYCLELRAENSDCVQTEIDSHFCMHALDNVPTTEAILKKNKSRSFWQCPCCPSILNHKTQQTKIQNGDQEIVKKTALYALRLLLLEHKRRRHGRHTCRRRLARAREPTLDTRCRGGRVRQGGLVKCGVSGTGQNEQTYQYTRDGKNGGTVAPVEHELE